MDLPPPPARSFASDNAAGAHPAVIEAVAAANAGHALAYGDDRWTRECTGALAELFGGGEALLAFNGTGANILGLLTMLRPADAVVCARQAHIEVDEAGAAERIIGAKLIDLPTPDGKLVADQVRDLAHMLGNEHHVQPAVVSITQSTELGTLYSADEVAALCEAAHGLGMRVHMDGARAANAAAALGGTAGALRSFTREAGVDVVTFGGTKNGMLGGEAVVFLDPALAARARHARKTATQLASKMRFIAAQFLALLDDDRWLRLAGDANAMAARLYGAVAGLPGVDVGRPAVNGLFPVLPAAAVAPLREWSFVWDWDPHRHQVRWMTAWDTTPEDVDRFAAGVAAAVAAVSRAG
ncbi:MAG: low specificity L-threonine aldolase [Thermoleophilia bacterium]